MTDRSYSRSEPDSPTLCRPVASCSHVVQGLSFKGVGPKRTHRQRPPGSPPIKAWSGTDFEESAGPIASTCTASHPRSGVQRPLSAAAVHRYELDVLQSSTAPVRKSWSAPHPPVTACQLTEVTSKAPAVCSKYLHHLPPSGKSFRENAWRFVSNVGLGRSVYSDLCRLAGRPLEDVSRQVVRRGLSGIHSWDLPCSPKDVQASMERLAAALEREFPDSPDLPGQEGHRVDALLDIHLATSAGGILHNLVQGSAILLISVLIAAMAYDAAHPSVTAQLKVNFSISLADSSGRTAKVPPGVTLLFQLLQASGLSEHLDARSSSAVKRIVEHLICSEKDSATQSSSLSKQFRLPLRQASRWYASARC